MFICFDKLQFSHLRNEDIRSNLTGLDMRMKLANGSQKNMSNEKRNPNVGICCYPAHSVGIRIDDG